MISPSQKPLPDKTQHSRERETSMPPRGIRTSNPSKRAAVNREATRIDICYLFGRKYLIRNSMIHYMTSAPGTLLVHLVPSPCYFDITENIFLGSVTKLL